MSCYVGCISATENRSVGGSIPPLGTIKSITYKACPHCMIFCVSIVSVMAMAPGQASLAAAPGTMNGPDCNMTVNRSRLRAVFDYAEQLAQRAAATPFWLPQGRSGTALGAAD